MNTPLPCPFCGHIGVSVITPGNHKWRAAQCNNCGAQSSDVRWIWNEPNPEESAAERAITEWNTRA